MAIGASVVGAVGSLIGGALGGKSKPYKLDGQIWDAARGARLASEDFGFNPLTLLGIANASGGGSYGGENYMGAAISDAAMMLADGMTKRQDAQKLQQAQMANAALQKKVTDLTLRPKVGGVYPQFGGGNVQSDWQAGGSVPVARAGVGARAAGGAASVAPFPVDTSRDIDRTKVTDDGGFAVVDNPNISARPFPVPAFNGEILDVGQAIVLGASLGVDKGRRRLDEWGEAYDRFTGRDKPLEYLSDSFRDAIKPRKKPKKSKHALNALGF